MSVNITSTSDTPEQVLAAIGGAKSDESKSEEAKSASDKISDETKEASDASENVLEADESESEDESNDDEKSKDDQHDKPKKQGGFKKRIDKLNQKISAKDQEVEYWKAEALKGKSKDDVPVKEKAVQVDSDEPSPDSFDTHAEYVKAVAKWTYQQASKETESKTREQNLKADYEKTQNAFRDKVTEFAKTKPDFKEAIEDVDDVIMSLGIRDSVLSSDEGAALLYELAKNRSEYERINALPYAAAAREIGKIEARIARSESAEKKQTKAPAPINPIGSKSSSSLSKDPGEMGFDEFKKWRNGDLKKRT